MTRLLTQQGISGAATISSDDLSELVAGKAIAKDDLVQMATDGKVYPLASGDIGKIANAGTAIFPETSVASVIADICGWRPALLRHSNGDIYIVSAPGSTIRRYSREGVLKASLTINSGSANYLQWRLVELSNGSMAVAWTSGSPIYVYFAVVPADFSTFSFWQGSYIQRNTSQFGLCALSGGGFALAWSDYNSTAVRFRVFDNAGTPTIADTQWGTAAVSDPASSTICQLSNGNLLLVRSGQTAGVNTKYAIYTINGVAVKTETQLATETTPEQPFIAVAGSGFFCLRIGSAGAGKYFVFSNDGTQQGAMFSLTETGNKNPAAILWDGQHFYIVTGINGTTGTRIRLVRLPTTGGASAVTYDTYVTTTAATSSAIDAYWEGDDIAVISLPWNSPQKPSYGVVSKAGAIIFPPMQFGSPPSSIQGNCVKGFNPGIDFSCGAMWEEVSSANVKVTVAKDTSTAILGVAQAAATKDQPVLIAKGPGVYRVNPLALSISPLPFDQTTGTTVPGNKGSLLTNSVILKGI